MLKQLYKSLFRKSSMLRKLLLSILFLICTPLLLIQLFTIQNTTFRFTEAQHNHTMSFMQSMNTAFDEQISAIGRYSIRIAGEEELKYPLLTDVPEYKLYTAASKVKEYNAAYPLIQQAGVYYPDTDRVLYNGYCYTLQEFAQLHYEGNSQGGMALADFLNHVHDTGFFATDKYPDSVVQQLLFARSVAVDGGVQENATVFFAIENQDLAKWCSGFIPHSAGFAITTADGEILLSTGMLTTDLFRQPEYKTFTTDLGRHMYELQDAEDTLIYKYQSPESDFLVFTAMPQSVTNGEINQYLQQVRLSLILMVLVVVIFTVITVYINYKPIWALMRKHAPLREAASASEMDLLDSAFFLRDEQINSQDNLIRTFLISDILSGVQVDKKEVERYFPKGNQMLVAVSLTDIPFTTTQTSIMIEKALQRYHLNLLVTTLPQRKETLFVIYSNKKDDFTDREERLNQVVLHATGSECAFVSGCVVNNIHNVEQSYKDALQSYYALTEHLRIEDPYPVQIIQDFGNAVRRNNFDDALLLTEQIRSRLSGYSNSYQKLIAYDMVRTYIHNIPENEKEDLDYILLAENAILMMAYLYTAITKRQHESEHSNKDINREVKMLLVEYVDKNCLDSAICLTSAADYMNTSIYTVSRLFKEATGMGFKDYITSKRLKHACHLLKTTNMSVNAIATVCGFERIAYFSTIFKNEYGVAPSVYRNS